MDIWGPRLRRGGLIAVALALVLSACSTDEAGEYFAAVRTVNEAYAADEAALGGVGPDSSIEDLQGFFAERTTALDGAVTGLSDLSPPSEYATPHTEFVDGLAHFADLSGAIAAETQSLESGADVNRLALHPVFGIAPSNEAEEAAVDACRALQELADEGDVAVDLACEQLS